MSFLTCFWLLPQKEHLSRSPPSPIRATSTSLCSPRPTVPSAAPGYTTGADCMTYDGTAFGAAADPLNSLNTTTAQTLARQVTRTRQLVVLTASRLDLRVLITSSTRP